MSKRKERNMSGTFIAVIEGEVLGPYTGREKAIKEAKDKMASFSKTFTGDGYETTLTEADAEIYHRVAIVKSKNTKEETSETEQDIPSNPEESGQGDTERTAL